MRWEVLFLHQQTSESGCQPVCQIGRHCAIWEKIIPNWSQHGHNFETFCRFLIFFFRNIFRENIFWRFDCFPIVSGRAVKLSTFSMSIGQLLKAKSNFVLFSCPVMSNQYLWSRVQRCVALMRFGRYQKGYYALPRGRWLCSCFFPENSDNMFQITLKGAFFCLGKNA
jgi:hypothetical protein